MTTFIKEEIITRTELARNITKLDDILSNQEKAVIVVRNKPKYVVIPYEDYSNLRWTL